jgi:hypothetical protein
LKCEKALGLFVWGLAGVHFADASAIPPEKSAFRKTGPKDQLPEEKSPDLEDPNTDFDIE